MPTVAACQTTVDDLDPESNFERVESRIAGLPNRTDVAVFPEYCLTGFGEHRLSGRRTVGSDRDFEGRSCAVWLVGWVQASQVAKGIEVA